VLDVGVGLILPEQAVRNVLVDHRRDPLAGVHRAKEDDSRLRARARLSNEMEALDVPLFKRLACGKDPGQGMVFPGEAMEVFDMGLVAVVFAEPGLRNKS
jgi:hypothetical protein